MSHVQKIILIKIISQFISVVWLQSNQRLYNRLLVSISFSQTDEVFGENLRPGRLVGDSAAILAGYGSWSLRLVAYPAHWYL